MPADRLIHPRLGHSAKVGSLSDLEFRVWIIYQVASDDYGVMRMSAVTVQAADDALARRRPQQIDAALAKLAAIDLVQTFEHQGRQYCYQRDWQSFQRVKHPRETMQPQPPRELVAKCSPSTRALFANHKLKGAEALLENSPKTSETLQQPLSENGSLACARTRETANGQRLTANGSEGVQGEDGPPMDVWARELVNLYPAQGRCSSGLVERPLFAVLTEGDIGETPIAAWTALQARLEAHKRSHQWRVKEMIPRLDKWLREGLYLQELPEVPVSMKVTDKTARTLASGAEFAKGGDRGSH